MPAFRCDYLVAGDLVLPPGAPELRVSAADFEFTFRNDTPDEHGHTHGLVITVVGPAESLEVAEDTLRPALADRLDLLAFVTHSRFEILQPLRLVEWEAGQRQRQVRSYSKFDARYPPDPELDAKYLATTSELDGANPPPFARVALKHFRLGLLDEQPDVQFLRLWTALEIIAENVKNSTPVPIGCPACEEPLVCPGCGMPPTRVPFAKQAIESVIGNVTGEAARTISKRQFAARNGLVHGRGRESIEKECGMPMGELVNELGRLTWNAIMSTIPLAEKGPRLAFGHRDGEFVTKTMHVVALMEIEHNRNTPHPADTDFTQGESGSADGIPNSGRSASSSAVSAQCAARPRRPSI